MIKKGIYTYKDRFSENQQNKLPQTLRLNMISSEAITFRLLLGTLNIGIDGYTKDIKQNINYASLDYYVRVNKLSSNSILESNVPIIDNHEKFDKYMKKSRRNTPVYDKFLFEISNYFYQKHKKAHISAFIHLYRSVEYLSYAFPLIYASKSGDYMNSYKHLKSFFSEEQKSELKFFEIFIKNCIESSIIDTNISIKIEAPTENMKKEILKIIESLISGIIEDIDREYYTFNVKYKNIMNMIITLRNRFFHMSSTNEKNITSSNVLMDYLFESINDNMLNFIAIIYFEIVKFGVEEI